MMVPQMFFLPSLFQHQQLATSTITTTNLKCSYTLQARIVQCTHQVVKQSKIQFRLQST